MTNTITSRELMEIVSELQPKLIPIEAKYGTTKNPTHKKYVSHGTHVSRNSQPSSLEVSYNFCVINEKNAVGGADLIKVKLFYRTVNDVVNTEFGGIEERWRTYEFIANGAGIRKIEKKIDEYITSQYPKKSNPALLNINKAQKRDRSPPTNSPYRRRSW